MKLEIDFDKELEKNTEIFENNKKIGFITSSAYSPSLKKVVALGFLNKGYYDTVKEVEIGKNKIKALVL